jgi:hypothetical protein
MKKLIRLFYTFFALLAGVHSFVAPARKPNVAAGNRVLGKSCEPFHFLKNLGILKGINRKFRHNSGSGTAFKWTNGVWINMIQPLVIPFLTLLNDQFPSRSCLRSPAAYSLCWGKQGYCALPIAGA